MTPQSIGLPRNRIVLRKHSGRHVFTQRLEDVGYGLTKEEINRFFPSPIWSRGYTSQAFRAVDTMLFALTPSRLTPIT
jgi:isopropylmalate/homocitrate/citramalate synthase